MTSTTTTAPQVTMTGPDTMGYYRFYVDGESVVTISQAMSGRLWKCDPNHKHGRMGGCSWVPLGEHLEGCGYVASGAEWHVYLTRSLGGGRFYKSLPDALVEGERMAEGYTRCSQPVACRLCRLPKRHVGPCQPYV